MSQINRSPYRKAYTLSNPTGPSDVLTMLAIAETAVTFCVLTSCPDSLVPCSCRLFPAWPAIFKKY